MTDKAIIESALFRGRYRMEGSGGTGNRDLAADIVAALSAAGRHIVSEQEGVWDGEVRTTEHPFDEWDPLRRETSTFVRLYPVSPETDHQ